MPADCGLPGWCDSVLVAIERPLPITTEGDTVKGGVSGALTRVPKGERLPYLDVRDWRDATADGTNYALAVNRAVTLGLPAVGGRAELVLPSRAEAYRGAMPIPSNTPVRGNGSATEIIQDQLGYLFRVTGSHGIKASLTVDAFAGANLVVLPTGAGAAFNLGDLLGLDATTVVYGTAGRTRDMRRVVAKSGDTLTLDMPLLFDFLVSASARYWKPNPVRNASFQDFLLSNPDPAAKYGYLVLAEVVDGLRIGGVDIRDGGGGVGLVDVIQAEIDGVMVDRLRNGTVFGGDPGVTTGPDLYRPAYGYGVWAAGACSLVTIRGLQGTGTRHLFTTLTRTETDGTLWGGPREVLVSHGNGSGADYSYSIWDTHEYGSDITFESCKGSGATQTGVAAFQIRSKRTRIVNGEGKRCFRGVMGAGPGYTEDLSVEGGEYSYNLEAGIGDPGLRTRVVGTHIHHNGDYGISCSYPSVDAIYRDNDIIDNDGAGISFRAQPGFPTVFAINPLVQGNNIPFSSGQFWGVENLPATGRALDNVLPGYAGGNGFRTAHASSVIKRNVGFVTENGGVATVANGGTIVHGMQRAPTRAVATGTVAGRRVNVTAISATTLTISLQDAAGANVTVAEPIYWMAESG
jgi:hypothetical protein